jgi:hypothetical protein
MSATVRTARLVSNGTCTRNYAGLSKVTALLTPVPGSPGLFRAVSTRPSRPARDQRRDVSKHVQRHGLSVAYWESFSGAASGAPCAVVSTL